MDTSNIRVCVDVDKVLYATQYQGYLRLVFGDNAVVNVRLSIDEFYNLVTGKSK